jgi:hypothetical protein
MLVKTKIIVIGLLVSLAQITNAGINPKKLISQINAKFNKVSDYKASAKLQFDIPNVKMSNMGATVLYKKPGKFKIKAPGILFLPKQNPLNETMQIIADTSAYQAISMGTEIVNGKTCQIINILPIKQIGELVLGKFWIDEKGILIVKSEITTKNNGTIITENSFGTNAAYALPDQIKVTMEVSKFKIPKMLAMDINKKKKKDANPNAKEKAVIIMNFSNYVINKSIPDAEFIN